MSKKTDAAKELEQARQVLRELGSKATQSDVDRVKDADKAWTEARKQQ